MEIARTTEELIMQKLLSATVTALCLSTHANAEITIGGQPADGVPVRGNGLPEYRCTVEQKMVIRSRPNGPIGVYAYVFDKQGKWIFVEGTTKGATIK
jgi:hypothetical protein